MKRPGEAWITSEEAAAILAVTRERVNQMAREGKLSQVDRKTTRGRVWFSLPEVEELAAQRSLARWRRGESERAQKAWERLRWILRWARLPLSEGDAYITVAEAARILDVGVSRIAELVRRGQLYGRQKQPGCPGSRMRLKRSQVEYLRDREEHQRRRAAYERGLATTEKAAGGWEEAGCPRLPWRQPSRATARDRGVYYTAKQACLVLGIGRGALGRLRESGRLPGVRLIRGRPLPWRPKEERWMDRRRWWWFRKADVHALLADPQYRKRRGM